MKSSGVLGDRRVLKHQAYKLNFRKSHLLSLLFLASSQSFSCLSWGFSKQLELLLGFSRKADKTCTKMICTWATQSGREEVLWRREAGDRMVVSETSLLASFHFLVKRLLEQKTDSYHIFLYILRTYWPIGWSSQRAWAWSRTKSEFWSLTPSSKINTTVPWIQWVVLWV